MLNDTEHFEVGDTNIRLDPSAIRVIAGPLYYKPLETAEPSRAFVVVEAPFPVYGSVKLGLYQTSGESVVGMEDTAGMFLPTGGIGDSGWIIKASPGLSWAGAGGKYPDVDTYIYRIGEELKNMFPLHPFMSKDTWKGRLFELRRRLRDSGEYLDKKDAEEFAKVNLQMDIEKINNMFKEHGVYMDGSNFKEDYLGAALLSSDDTISALAALYSALKKRGHHKQASIIIKLANEYTVVGGDTLGQIAVDNNITVSEIRQANPQLVNDRINVGQVLNIPQPANATEIVAATLLGEGGSLAGIEMMKRIMTIIVNRASYKGVTNYEIVKDSEAFSYWIGKDEDVELNGPDGRSGWKNHSLWTDAMNIAENELTDPELGSSTMYYAHAGQVDAAHRNYDQFPAWADPDGNSCWEEIATDQWHVYGNAGAPWNNCLPS
tara:strand:- start:195 stop:1496 length:1302 start_codon:yes stop_codon:yes gene_type:complete